VRSRFVPIMQVRTLSPRFFRDVLGCFLWLQSDQALSPAEQAGIDIVSSAAATGIKTSLAK
jgi:hypothetical protein